MTHIEKSIHVDAPLRVAYKRWAEFGDFLLRSNNGAEDVQQVDECTVQWRSRLGATDVVWTGTLAFEHSGPRSLGRVRGPGASAGSLTFEAVDRNCCRIISRLEFDPEEFSAHSANSPWHVITRIMGDLRRYKDFFERGSRLHGSQGRALDQRAIRRALP